MNKMAFALNTDNISVIKTERTNFHHYNNHHGYVTLIFSLKHNTRL